MGPVLSAVAASRAGVGRCLPCRLNRHRAVSHPHSTRFQPPCDAPLAWGGLELLSPEGGLGSVEPVNLMHHKPSSSTSQLYRARKRAQPAVSV